MIKKLFSFFKKENEEANLNETEDDVPFDESELYLHSRTFRIANQEVKEIGRYSFDKIFESKYKSYFIGSISITNPSDIFYYLKELSTSVELIQIDFDEYEGLHGNNIVQIEIFPKYENQVLNLPSIFNIVDSIEGIYMNFEDYFKFINLLEDVKTPDYLPLPIDVDSIEDYMGRLVSRTKTPNDTIYVIWDIDDIEDYLVLIELGKPKTKTTLSLKHDTVYLLEASEVFRRVTNKQ